MQLSLYTIFVTDCVLYCTACAATVAGHSVCLEVCLLFLMCAVCAVTAVVPAAHGPGHLAQVLSAHYVMYRVVEMGIW